MLPQAPRRQSPHHNCHFNRLIVMISSLIAMTIIDARTFTIPLSLTWTPAVVALAAHPVWALVLQLRGKSWGHVAEGDWWALAKRDASS